MRLDIFLAERGLVRSRSDAARKIREGAVRYGGKICTKASLDIPEETPSEAVTVDTESHPYVSRGGEKLKAALDAFGLSPEGLCAIDIGASSGGFTDCLLRHGARCVLAVDAGYGQLDPSLLADARVKSYEHYNARHLRREDFPEIPQFAVMDVSFISQTLILPALAALLPADATYIGLIKPQFEVGRDGIGKGGIVRDDRLRRTAVERVISFAESVGFSPLGCIDSPIPGGDGNREFLAAFKRR